MVNWLAKPPKALCVRARNGMHWRLVARTMVCGTGTWLPGRSTIPNAGRPFSGTWTPRSGRAPASGSRACTPRTWKSSGRCCGRHRPAAPAGRLSASTACGTGMGPIDGCVAAARRDRMPPVGSFILHDCLPLDRITSERVRTTHFYSGDVWKLPMCPKVHRPDLRMVTIRTPPTGLCLVSRLDPGSDLLVRNYAEYVAEYTPLDFDYYKDHPEQMPENIPNTFAAVSGWIDSLIRERDPAVDRSHK